MKGKSPDNIKNSNNENTKSYEASLKLNEILNNLPSDLYNILKKYESWEFIGSGRDSYVYKAKVKETGKEIAIKIFKLNKDDNKYMNEKRISIKLKNPNVINCYFFYEDKKNRNYYIIMDYGKLGNLREFQNKFLQKNYISETLLSFITYQILVGLKYIHLCKIAHLDLKPQNIIIDEYLNVKIIDFSISLDYSKINSKEIKLRLGGTYFYMAPEVFRCDIIKVKDLNKVDLFALGVILFNLAFGTYPFGLNKEDSNNVKVVYKKIMNDLIIENEDNYYSSHFIDFIQQLLEKDINKRININEALNNYWVKSAHILLDEKEKAYNAVIFLGYLVTDHIKSFDDYINKGNLYFDKQPI